MQLCTSATMKLRRSLHPCTFAHSVGKSCHDLRSTHTVSSLSSLFSLLPSPFSLLSPAFYVLLFFLFSLSSLFSLLPVALHSASCVLPTMCACVCVCVLRVCFFGLTLPPPHKPLPRCAPSASSQQVLSTSASYTLLPPPRHVRPPVSTPLLASSRRCYFVGYCGTSARSPASSLLPVTWPLASNTSLL
jgi:hypothetical protein